MSSTAKTTNKNLSQFIGTDKPSWLTDYNTDMNKIDLALKSNEDAINSTDLKTDTALSETESLDLRVTSVEGDVDLLNPYKAKVDTLEIELPLKAPKLNPVFTGIVDVENGQVKFPTVQNPSSNPNTLDDYEEGTFTPILNGMSVSGVGTYSKQIGKYTKIGNLVFIKLSIVITAHTGTGTMFISGLPFSSELNYDVPCSVNVNRLSYIGQLSAFISNNGIYLVQMQSGNDGVFVPMDTNFGIDISCVFTV